MNRYVYIPRANLHRFFYGVFAGYKIDVCVAAFMYFRWEAATCTALCLYVCVCVLSRCGLTGCMLQPAPAPNDDLLLNLSSGTVN